MDFKAQIIEDLKVFHNPGEFGTITNIWYNRSQYTVPVVIEHETRLERKKLMSDHEEGIHKVEATMYLSLADLGFTPRKGSEIEVEEAGVVTIYEIAKVVEEYGEIVLGLEAFDE